MIPRDLDAIRVRRLTVSDIDSAARLLTRVFGGTQDRRQDLQRFFRIQGDGGIAATCEGELIGMVGWVEFDPFVSAGMMAVVPQYQRRGIGALLFGRLLDSIDRRGWRMSILEASAAGAKLYTKMGYIDEGETHQLRLVGPVRATGRVSCRVRAVGSEDVPALEEFDAPIFGARRGRLVALYLDDFPDRAFLTQDQTGKITGYMIAQHQRLGPWVARTAQATEDLLQAGLQLTFAGVPSVLVPARNRHAITLLQHYGFELVETHHRMRRGGESPPGQRESILGLASYFLG